MLPDARAVQIVPGQRQEILSPLSKRRQDQADDVQAVEEVLSKAACPQILFEPTIRGGDDANVRVPFLRFPHALVGAVVQESQQPGLGLQREIADLVEEEQAPLRLLNLPFRIADGARERPLLVPEQRAVHELRRERRTAHGDERSASTRALLPEPPSHDVLASATFATEEHGNVGGRHAARLGQHHLKLRTRGLEEVVVGARLLQSDLDLGQLLLGASCFQRAAGRMPDLIGREGLRKVVEGAAFHRFDGALERGQRRDDNDRRARLPSPNIGDRVEPRVLSQPNVDQHEVERAAFERLERGRRAADSQNSRSIRFQTEAE